MVFGTFLSILPGLKTELENYVLECDDTCLNNNTINTYDVLKNCLEECRIIEAISEANIKWILI